jgi:AI-2 transport protein TqsA
MKKRKTTNILLLFIVIPLTFYVLKILSFIFIPLVSAMFIALLFLPIMRWLQHKNVPKSISILIVIILIAAGLKLGGELVQLSTNEIASAKSEFFVKAETKLVKIVTGIESFFGIPRMEGERILSHYIEKNSITKNIGVTIDFLMGTLSMTLMTIFFVLLLLAGSINFQKLMSNALFNINYSAIKTFMKIEKDIIKFIKVKFLISLLTGIGFSLACVFFDISFPIFWGVLAFLINFVQMVGSVVSVLSLSLFAFIELDPTGTLLFFILTITAIQVLMGGVLEPIFMGKTFSVNVITVLVMLMFWGFLWGIPGLVLSIPITVFLKIVLEQFPKTKMIANLMSEQKDKVNIFKRNNK